jgi:hypothetical protein
VEPRIARLAAMQEPLWPESRREDDAAEPGVPRRVRVLAGVFVGAVLTFVVSLSAAVGLELAPDHRTTTASPRELANAAAEPTMVPHAVPAAPAAPPAPQAPPERAAEPAVVSPPDAAPLVEVPDAAQMVVPEAAPPIEAPPEGAPEFEAPDAPPPGFVPPDPGYVSPPAALPPKHPILSRIPIINRIPGVRGPADQPQVQQDPGVLYPAPTPP